MCRRPRWYFSRIPPSPKVVISFNGTNFSFDIPRCTTSCQMVSSLYRSFHVESMYCANNRESFGFDCCCYFRSLLLPFAQWCFRKISLWRKPQQMHRISILQTYTAVRFHSMAVYIHVDTAKYSTVHSGADQRKRQSSASLAFVRGINRRPVNFPHKWPVTRKMFPFDDVIIKYEFKYNIPNECEIHIG